MFADLRSGKNGVNIPHRWGEFPPADIHPIVNIPHADFHPIVTFRTRIFDLYYDYVPKTSFLLIVNSFKDV